MAFMDLLLWVAIVKLAVYQLSECQVEQCEEFDVRPEDVVAKAGEMAMMTCYYNQSTSEVLTWDMEMTSITSDSSSCDCTILDSGHRLQFNNVTLDNVGRYTCNILVGAGDARGCSATLKLAEAPVISDTMPGNSVTANGASQIQLSALVIGDPPPMTVWSHNGQHISVSDDHQITNSTESGGNGEGVRVRLTVLDVDKGDRGVYSLHATNRAGEDSHEWTVSVPFAEVNPIRITSTDSQVTLICSGQYFTTGDESVEWERGEGTPVGATTTLDRDGYEFTFESTLIVDLNTCHGTETVKCTLALDNENQEVETTASICGDSCSLPTSIDASVEDCTKLTVRLSGGNAGSYTVEYRKERGETDWMQRSITLTNSQQDFTGVADLEEDTTYIVRVTCSQGTSSPIMTVSSSSKPTAVVGVETHLIYNSSGTFSTLRWERSSLSDVDIYHITWEENSVKHELNVTGTHHDWAIQCDVVYTYRVAAINPCGMGPQSFPVVQQCSTVPPPLRVALKNVTFIVTGSGPSLVLTFTISYIYPIKSVHVDIEEQDSNFVASRTLNYSLTEDVYSSGRVCAGGLSEGAHYLICLRVDYSEVGLDSSCIRFGPVDEAEKGISDEHCPPPTSTQQVTSSEDAQTNPTIPDWGIAVIVVGALLLVALIFCFLGLCFACQTSQSKNVDFGSSSSLNTERGGNVVPTTMHMHNPRAMSPTRSCLKYNRERGHTWNDHVDTLRQMETDKGTHV